MRELDESVEKTEGQPVNWVVTLGEIDVTNLDAAIDNFNTPKQPRGMDFNHLLFQDVVLQAQDFLYSQTRMTIDLNQLQLKEKSGFKIEDFQAAIVVDSTRARLADLNLETGNSHLIKEAGVRYPSLSAAMENPELISLAIDVEDSYIGMKDVLYFAPDLADNPSFRKIANSTIKLELAAEGPMENIQIRQLRASGLKGTVIVARGNVRNITDPNQLYLDLVIPRFSTTRTDVLALVPKNVIPPDIRIPQNVSLSGSYEGSLTNFDAQANIQSSFGNLVADINMDAGSAGAEPFTATFKSNRFDLGQLLTGDFGLGEVAFTAIAKGKGLAPEDMVATINADVQKLEYNNYTYQDLNAQIDINKNIYDIDVTSEDKNLAFNVEGRVNLRGEQPSYDLNLNLSGANLQALQFFPEDLRLQGNIQTNLSGTDLSTLEGTVTAQNLVVVHQGEQFPVDSLSLAINQTADGMLLKIDSDVVTGRFVSGNDLAQLPTALQKHFSNYFDLQPDPPFPANLNLEDFAFNFNLKKTGLIASFVPGLELLVPGDTLQGIYNGETQQLLLNANIKRIKYTGYDLQGINLKINGDRNVLGYNISMSRLADSTIMVKNISLTGEARDNEISTRLAIAEDNGKERFVLGGL
ncbi:MAG: hypothetical protein LPK19_02225, partial [Hymenobacteraceae bacterium]|nr:hypothetical protein [Hymenobacteraceae bacterium]MDX5394994.1 hypothetical protein [Hymenobacteraceae bacterium]MDX5511027.1 hypothetical protein [Hymenobacteraceae bacterium]